MTQQEGSFREGSNSDWSRVIRGRVLLVAAAAASAIIAGFVGWPYGNRWEFAVWMAALGVGGCSAVFLVMSIDERPAALHGRFFVVPERPVGARFRFSGYRIPYSALKAVVLDKRGKGLGGYLELEGPWLECTFRADSPERQEFLKQLAVRAGLALIRGEADFMVDYLRRKGAATSPPGEPGTLWVLDLGAGGPSRERRKGRRQRRIALALMLSLFVPPLSFVLLSPQDAGSLVATAIGIVAVAILLRLFFGRHPFRDEGVESPRVLLTVREGGLEVAEFAYFRRELVRRLIVGPRGALLIEMFASPTNMRGRYAFWLRRELIQDLPGFLEAMKRVCTVEEVEVQVPIYALGIQGLPVPIGGY